MKQVARLLVNKASPALYETIRQWRLFQRLATRDNSYLVTSGFLKSHRFRYPCDLDGTPVPWMNYGVIAFLQERLRKDMTLFEYGSGYSTLFYSNLVKRVVSVEYDKEWYENIKNKAGDNVRLIYQPLDSNGEYSRLIIHQKDKFDVIVIDGRDRVRCAINSLKSLSDDGVVIFDDSERVQYCDGIEFLLENGFRKIDFVGLKPACNDLSAAQTSVFYKTNNCMDI